MCVCVRAYVRKCWGETCRSGTVPVFITAALQFSLSKLYEDWVIPLQWKARVAVPEPEAGAAGVPAVASCVVRYGEHVTGV